MSAICLDRFFVAGFPEPDQRPGMMIAVEPPTYVPLAYLKIATYLPDHCGIFERRLPAAVAQGVAFVVSLAILSFGLFFFMMAFCAILALPRRMSFHLTWYGLIFPNVGLLSTLGLLGAMVPSDGVEWAASVCTALLCGLWLFVTAMHVRAIWGNSEYLW